MSVPLRFLVAEDSATVQALYRSVLRMQWPDAEVAVVASEEAAVREAAASRWDLIVMDGELSPGSGVQAIRQIRAAGVLVPVLFVSGENETVLRAALDAGAMVARQKPIPVHEFIAVVDKLLNP